MYVKNEVEGLNEIYQLIAQTTSLEDTIKIYQQFKGLTITFPTKLISREFIIKTLKQELLSKDALSNRDIQKHARHFDYSERQIKRFVQEAKKDLDGSTVEEEVIPYVLELLAINKKEKEEETNGKN